MSDNRGPEDPSRPAQAAEGSTASDAVSAHPDATSELPSEPEQTSYRVQDAAEAHSDSAPSAPPYPSAESARESYGESPYAQGGAQHVSPPEGGPQPGDAQQSFQQEGYQQPGYPQNYQQSGYPSYPQPGAPQDYSPSGYPQGYQQSGYPQGYGQPMAEQKSKLAAGLLGIFLGSLGIHNFYLGRTGIALAQLLISVVSLGILAPVSAIWGFIEGVMILVGAEPFRRDAKGVPLRD